MNPSISVIRRITGIKCWLVKYNYLRYPFIVHPHNNNVERFKIFYYEDEHTVRHYLFIYLFFYVYYTY